MANDEKTNWSSAFTLLVVDNTLTAEQEKQVCVYVLDCFQFILWAMQVMSHLTGNYLYAKITFTGKKQYSFDKCNTSFSTNIHTGVKPYKCDQCYKTFCQYTGFFKSQEDTNMRETLLCVMYVAGQWCHSVKLTHVLK
jgi:hypothetical protein